MSSGPGKVVDFWSEATWIDYLAAAGIVVPYFVITSLTRHADWLRSMTQDERLTIYATGAQVVSIVGGLCAIAITIYITVDGDRVRAVRASHNYDLRRNWRALFVGLGLSALACIVAQIIDVKHDPFSSRIVFAAAMVFAAWRFVRLLWLFDALIGISDRDLTDVTRIAAPELGKSWRKNAKS